MTPWQRLVATGAVLACAAGGVLAFPELRFEPVSPGTRAVVRLDLLDAGASRAQLDTQVARPLEAHLRQIDGVEDFESRIIDGQARIDVHVSVARARDVLERISVLLRDESVRPAVFEPPRVTLVDPTRAVARIVVRSDAQTPEALVAWIEEQLVQPLRVLPAVAGVSPEPGLRREIDVLPDQRRFGALGLTILDVAQALRRANTARVDALSVLPVRLPAGDSVPLSSLAHVVERPMSTSGELAVGIEARAGVGTLTLLRAIEAHLEWLRANGQIPVGVSLALTPNREALTRPLRLAAAALSAGLVISILVAGIACGARPAFVLGSALLLALVGAAALLSALGRTLTPATLGAFAVGAALASAAAILRRGGRLPGSRLALALAAAGGFWAWPALRSVDGLPVLQDWFVALLASTAISSLLSGVLFRPAARMQGGGLAAFEQRATALTRRARRAPRAAVAAGTALLIALFVSLFLMPWTGSDTVTGERGWQVRLYGEDTEALVGVGAEALGQLQGVEHEEAVTSSASAHVLRWHAELVPEQAQALGLGADTLERILRFSLGGVVVREFGEGFRRTSLRLQLPESERSRTDAVERLLVAGELDRRPLALMRNVAQVERRWDFAETRRDARGDYVEFEGKVRDAALGEVAAAVGQALEGLLPAGSIRWTGEVARMERAASVLLAAAGTGLALTLLLVYVAARRWTAMACGALGVLAALPGVAAGAIVAGALVPEIVAAGVTLAGLGAGAAVLLAPGGVRSADGAMPAAGLVLILGPIPLASLFGEIWLGLFVMSLLSGASVLALVVALTVPPCYFLAGIRGMK